MIRNKGTKYHHNGTTAPSSALCPILFLRMHVLTRPRFRPILHPADGQQTHQTFIFSLLPCPKPLACVTPISTCLGTGARISSSELGVAVFARPCCRCPPEKRLRAWTPLYGALTCVCARKRASRDGAACAGSGMAGRAGAGFGLVAFSLEDEQPASSVPGQTASSVIVRFEKGLCSGFGDEGRVLVEVEVLRLWLLNC